MDISPALQFALFDSVVFSAAKIHSNNKKKGSLLPHLAWQDLRFASECVAACYFRIPVSGGYCV